MFVCLDLSDMFLFLFTFYHGMKITIWGTCETPPFLKDDRCFYAQKSYRYGTIFPSACLIGLIVFGWAACEPVFRGVFKCVLFKACRRLFLCCSQIDYQQIGCQIASPMSPEMVTILFLSDGYYVFFFYLLVVLLLGVGRYGFSCHVDSKFHMMIFYGVNSSKVE